MRFRPFIKKILNPVLLPASRWYLSKERSYSYKDINIKVFPGVYHPGLFYSTKVLLKVLEDKKLKQRSFLELGAGTGLISVFAAKKGALVTASDISPNALSNIRLNASMNNVWVNAIYSDVFQFIPPSIFEWIVINPPPYPLDPKSDEDYSWHCGENYDFFRKLFRQIPEYINDRSTVIMILPEDCNIRFLKSMGSDFSWEKIVSKEIWREKFFVFRLGVS